MVGNFYWQPLFYNLLFFWAKKLKIAIMRNCSLPSYIVLLPSFVFYILFCYVLFLISPLNWYIHTRYKGKMFQMKNQLFLQYKNNLLNNWLLFYKRKKRKMKGQKINHSINNFPFFLHLFQIEFVRYFAKISPLKIDTFPTWEQTRIEYLWNCNGFYVRFSNICLKLQYFCTN